MNIRSVHAIAALFLIVGLFHGTADSATQSAREVVPQVQPKARPAVVYVTDFDLDYRDIRKESGVLGRREGRVPGGRIRERSGPLRGDQDPRTKAGNLIDLLSILLVQELNGRSIQSVRVPRGGEPGSSGWLIRGEFTEVDEGNRIKRAVIGFGAGATDMEIRVEVYDLGGPRDTPFLLMGTHTASGMAPGAVVTMNPYVAAAKFVLSKNASRKDVKNAASRIASELQKYMNEIGLSNP